MPIRGRNEPLGDRNNPIDELFGIVNRHISGNFDQKSQDDDLSSVKEVANAVSQDRRRRQRQRRHQLHSKANCRKINSEAVKTVDRETAVIGTLNLDLTKNRHLSGLDASCECAVSAPSSLGEWSLQKWHPLVLLGYNDILKMLRWQIAVLRRRSIINSKRSKDVKCNVTCNVTDCMASTVRDACQCQISNIFAMTTQILICSGDLDSPRRAARLHALCSEINTVERSIRRKQRLVGDESSSIKNDPLWKYRITVKELPANAERLLSEAAHLPRLSCVCIVDTSSSLEGSE